MLNHVANPQQHHAGSSVRVQQLMEEIRMRIANKANAEVTFDKVIECFAALTNYAKENSIARRNWADQTWRRKRNDALDKLLELVAAVDPSKPLRAQMVAQGHDWLSEFDDYKLWRDVMTYCYISRYREGLVQTHFNTVQVTDEALLEFAEKNPQEIESALIHGVLPREGKLLAHPLAQEGAQDHWNYMQKLLQFSTREQDATPQPAELPGRD